MRAIIVFSVLVVIAAAQNTTIPCDKSANYGSSSLLIYNNACPLDRPYCTGQGLCSECAVGKDSLCDCPPNHRCAAARFNAVRNADFCTPVPIADIDTPCADNNGCPVELADQTTTAQATAFFLSCVNSQCRYCNGRETSSSIVCIQERLPTGADPRLYGSKTGTSRVCKQSADAWNSNTRVLDPALPTDQYAYERTQYAPPSASTAPATGQPSESPAPAASSASAVGEVGAWPMAVCAFVGICMFFGVAGLAAGG